MESNTKCRKQTSTESTVSDSAPPRKMSVVKDGLVVQDTSLDLLVHNASDASFHDDSDVMDMDDDDSHAGYSDNDEEDMEYYSDGSGDAHHDFEFHTDAAPPARSYQTEHVAKSLEQAQRGMQETISDISDLFAVSAENAKALLNSFRWNRDKLVERFMENSDKVMKDAGLQDSAAPFELQRAPRNFVCPVCYSEASDTEDMQIVALGCRHAFCLDCYFQYVRGKIMDDGESFSIRCPDSKCESLLSDSFIESLVQEHSTISGESYVDILDRYKRLQFQSYVDNCPDLKWCSSAGCDSLVKCDVTASMLDRVVPTVSCSNGHPFCFGCSLEGHQPAVCSYLRFWNKKRSDEGKTGIWLSTNTKECPKCYSSIEKNGGCNHMTCKKCTHHFCWICMGDWSTHQDAYRCNRYESDTDKSARIAGSTTLSELKRFVHYLNRFENHEGSAKLASKHFEKMEAKMEEIQKSSSFSWIEVQFMRKAFNVVLECHETLKWTYCFAYYLARNHMTDLFEDNQRDLEMAVEALNEIIEQPIPEGTNEEIMKKLVDMKHTCLNKTEYCSKRREVLLEDTARGLAEGRWTFDVKLT